MTASDILRIKFQSHRQMAIYADRGVRGVISNVKGVLSDVYSGMERASWYTSCLTNEYADVCEALKSEETRMALSIYSVYRYREVIVFMIGLYIAKVLADVNGEKKDRTQCEQENGVVIKNENGSVRDVVRTATDLMASRAVGRSVRGGLTYALSQAIARSEVLSRVATERLSTVMPVFFFGLQVYGIEQKAALAARRLKVKDPRYYWILYKLELEMLYLFIEPVMSKVIDEINMQDNLSEMDVIDIIMGALNV